MPSNFQTFYKNVLEHTKTTGSIAPSSRHLAAAITRFVERKDKPIRILEVGPGTGPFTDLLVKKLSEGDILELCELNDSFVAHLQRRLDEEPEWRAHKEQVTIHHKPVQELEEKAPFDFIVSGLPFNNFEPDLVRGILSSYSRLLKPEGVLTFFEYAGVRSMKKLITGGSERKRVNAVGAVLREFLTKYEKEQIFVALNLPPSIVHVCRIGEPFK